MYRIIDIIITTLRHAAQAPSVVPVELIRRPYTIRTEAQVVSLLGANSRTGPVVAAGGEIVQRRTTDIAGADKVIRASIN